jgi:hypothetical protein
MKQLFIILLSFILLTSCAQSKVLTIQGQPTVVKPYGWVNSKARKNENVIYEVEEWSIIWSILGVRTIVVPIWLTGWKLFEPVDVKPESK